MQKIIDWVRKYEIEVLSWGVAFTLLWAGISGFYHPEDWIGFVPAWVTKFGVSREFFLQANGVFDVVVGLALISNVYRKWAAAFAGLFFAGFKSLTQFSDQ